VVDVVAALVGEEHHLVSTHVEFQRSSAERLCFEDFVSQGRDIV
jgi:hypothetical protein